MPISAELDQLSCELMGEALDMLADGTPILAVASVADSKGERLTCAFEEDSPEMCIDAACEWVIKKRQTSQYYAIAYEWAVANPDEDTSDEAYHDALLLEFGERSSDVAYSAYVLIKNKGHHEDFSYTDPAPAGEIPCLLA